MKLKTLTTTVLLLTIGLEMIFIKRVYPATRIYWKEFLRKKELKSLKTICLIWMDNAFKIEAIDQLRLVKNSFLKNNI